MLGGLIAAAIGWGIAAILRATVLHGPISFWKAFGIGAVVMVPLLAAIPDSSFAPIIGGALMVTLWQGYTGKSRNKTDTVHTPSVEKPTLKPVEEHKDHGPVKTERPQASKAHDDEKFFEQVATELEEGNRKKGLWLKAETKAGGDEDKARLLYIEWRVEQLSGEELEAQRQKEEAEGDDETVTRHLTEGDESLPQADDSKSTVYFEAGSFSSLLPLSKPFIWLVGLLVLGTLIRFMISGDWPTVAINPRLMWNGGAWLVFVRCATCGFAYTLFAVAIAVCVGLVYSRQRKMSEGKFILFLIIGFILSIAGNTAKLELLNPYSDLTKELYAIMPFGYTRYSDVSWFDKRNRFDPADGRRFPLTYVSTDGQYRLNFREDGKVETVGYGNEGVCDYRQIQKELVIEKVVWPTNPLHAEPGSIDEYLAKEGLTSTVFDGGHNQTFRIHPRTLVWIRVGTRDLRQNQFVVFKLQ